MSFESQPRYSPDGTTIAFLSDRSGVENLWIADADGGNPRAVGKDKPTKSRGRGFRHRRTVVAGRCI